MSQTALHWGEVQKWKPSGQGLRQTRPHQESSSFQYEISMLSFSPYRESTVTQPACAREGLNTMCKEPVILTPTVCCQHNRLTLKNTWTTSSSATSYKSSSWSWRMKNPPLIGQNIPLTFLFGNNPAPRKSKTEQHVIKREEIGICFLLFLGILRNLEF